MRGYLCRRVNSPRGLVKLPRPGQTFVANQSLRHMVRIEYTKFDCLPRANRFALRKSSSSSSGVSGVMTVYGCDRDRLNLIVNASTVSPYSTVRVSKGANLKGDWD